MTGFNFDPDRFVGREPATPPAAAEPAPVHADAIRGTVPGLRERDYRDLPREWAAGLRRMNAMDMPRGARRERWAELILDAHRFAWGFYDTALERGWSLETLFGFNPAEPFQDEAGLIFQIRGERVIALIKDDRNRSIAAIGKGVEQGYRYFYQRPVANAQLIWTARSIG
jgi:hypothetical protein